MSQENVETARRWLEGFNKTGMPPLDLCHEQIEIANPPEFPVRGVYRGHEGVREWRDQAFEVVDDVQIEPEKLIDVGDHQTVVMFLRLKGRASYSQIEIDEPWAAVWTIRDGKLYRGQGYVSRHKALEAAGLTE
jgi:ketosteroid isomerase-like protein